MLIFKIVYIHNLKIRKNDLFARQKCCWGSISAHNNRSLILEWDVHFIYSWFNILLWHFFVPRASYIAIICCYFFFLPRSMYFIIMTHFESRGQHNVYKYFWYLNKQCAIFAILNGESTRRTKAGNTNKIFSIDCSWGSIPFDSHANGMC